MIINKSSWHYRFLQFMNTYPMPSSLCGYFWELVGKLFLLLIGSFLVFLFTAGYAILAWSAFHNHSQTAFATFVCLVAVPTFTGILLGIAVIRDRIEQGAHPNIFFEMIKAVKNKVCPLITYKDET